MSPRLRSLLAQAGSFLLAGVLLYLALRGADLGEMLEALRHADYRWIVPLIVIVVASHVLRAWRWQMLLHALPADPAATEGDRPARVSVWTAFASLMIGYMVNYAAPRLGEVARTANVSARTKLRFSSVLGTVVAERLLDVLVLGLLVAGVFLLLLDRSEALHRLFIAPITSQIGVLPAIGLGALVLLIGLVVFFLFRQALRQQESTLALLWHRRVVPVLASFKDGLLTLRRTRRPFALVASTVLMWACYVLMAHLPFVMLGMAGAYDLTVLDSAAIMVLGAIGVALPAPGGVGTYHYITKATLVHLFAVAEEPALTYAVVTHAAQFVLYVLIGLLCLLLQGSSLRSLRTARTATSEEASV